MELSEVQKVQSELSSKSNSTPGVPKFRGKIPDLFHTRQRLCIQSGNRTMRWSSKEKGDFFYFLSPNRTGWGHWVGSLLFAVFYYLFAPGRCDQPVSLWDSLRTGIGSCCSSKSTLIMWEEVLENFSSFSFFLFYLLGLTGKILTDRYSTVCVLQIYSQTANIQSTRLHSLVCLLVICVQECVPAGLGLHSCV